MHTSIYINISICTYVCFCIGEERTFDGDPAREEARHGLRRDHPGGRILHPSSTQKGSKLWFLVALICTTRCWIPASASAKQRERKRVMACVAITPRAYPVSCIVLSLSCFFLYENRPLQPFCGISTSSCTRDSLPACRGHILLATSPQKWSKSPFSVALICTTSCRVATSAVQISAREGASWPSGRSPPRACPVASFL